MEYEEFELQLGPRAGAGESLHVRVLRSPAGAGGAQVPLAPLLGTAAGPRGQAAEIGATLFQTLFQGEVGNLFHASLQGAGRGLRLRLRIDPRDADLAPLHQVPWELLYRPTTEDFLTLNRATPLVRSFDIARPAALPEFEPPLRLLAVSGSQDPDNPLNLAAELAELDGTLHRNSDIQVEPLEDPEPRALRFALTRQPFDALHFMGHGVFDPLSGEGALLCRGPGGGRQPLGGRHLATKLKDLGSLRLVVLNACDTARASDTAGHNPFAGVATALVLGGVPAVVAMQSPIDDDHALAFSAAFYDRLAHGLTVEEAVAEGRQAIHSLRPNGTDWSVPVLFLRTPTGDLFRAAPRAPGDKSSDAINAADTAPRAPHRSSHRAALITTAGLACALAVVGLTKVVDFSEIFRSNGVTGVEPEEPLLPTPSATPGASPPEPVPKPSTSHSAQHSSEPRAPKPARSTRTVSVGDGLLRFQVSADSRIAETFAEALRTAAAPLPGFGFRDQTVRVEVSTPRIESSDQPGRAVCRLSATCRLENGSSVRIQQIDREAEASSPCEPAAEALAGALVDQLASQPL